METQKPLYNTRKWDNDFIRTLGYMTNISRFPEGYNQLLKSEGLIKRMFAPSSAPPRTNKSQQLKLLQKEQKKEVPKQQTRPKSAPAKKQAAQKVVQDVVDDSDVSSISDWGETFKNAPVVSGGEMGRSTRPKSAMYRS